jgi:hypothetical protein
VPRYKLGIGAFSYRMSGEGHEWRVAPVGTAGAPITFTQAMTLTTGGNLLVGTNLDAGNRISAQVTSSGVFQGAYTASNGADSDFTVRIRTNETQIANSTGGGVLSFATANSERARITSGGYFKASNTGVYGNAAGLGNNVNGLNHWFQNDQNDTVVVGVSSNTGSVVTSFASYLPSGSTGAHFAGFVNGGSVYRINANGSGGQVSDANLKTNITPATPKLADLNRVEVVTYNWKEDTGIGSQKEIGVIAQQLESVFPALVQTIEKDDGTEQKMVKYSVFVPILIKAVQELSAQNSALTDRIAALEAK